MAKTLQQELDEYRRLLSIFRKLYAEDGTITPDEQSHLDVLEGKIKQILPAATRQNAGNGNGQPFAAPGSPAKAKTTDAADILGGGTTVRADSQLPPAPALSDKEKAQRDYEAKLGRLKTDLDAVDKSKPTDATLMDIRAKILAARTNMELFANIRNFTAANEEIDRIPALLSKYKEGNAKAAAKKSYEEKFEAIKADLSELTRRRVEPNEPFGEKRQKIIDLTTQLSGAISTAGFDQEVEANYVLANKIIDELKQKIADYKASIKAHQDKSVADAKARNAQSQATAKTEFDKKMASIRSDLFMVTVSKPPDSDSAKIRDELVKADNAITTHVKAGDYVLANRTVDGIPPLLKGYWKAAYVAKRYSKNLLSTLFIGDPINNAVQSTPADAVSKGIHDKIKKLYGPMQDAEKAGDYATALKHLSDIIPLLSQYEKTQGEAQRAEAANQAKAKSLFEGKWPRLKPEVDKIIGDTPIDTTTILLRSEVINLERQIQQALPQKNYVAANNHVDRLSGLVEQYRAAMKDPKRLFEVARPKIAKQLDTALKPPRTEKFMISMQNQVKESKVKMDAAVAKNDYVTALKHLEALTGLLKQFHKEDRKTPQPLTWLLATSGSMDKKIRKMYNEAATKLDQIAQAYDDAKKAHQDTLNALKRIKDVQSLSDAILAGLFFAGLGGAIGGAVANLLKSHMTKAAADSMGGGALLDATKDIAKFTARLGPQLDGKSHSDSVTGLSVLDGDGGRLTRQFAGRLREEMNKLLDVLIDFDQQVKKAAAAGKTHVRIDGDPEETLDKDAFLKFLRGAPAADKKGFGKVIWAAWINEYAYKVKSTGQTIYITEQTITHEVENAFDERIIPDIMDQAGRDFNLYFELKKSELKAFEKMKQMSGKLVNPGDVKKNPKYE
jgi:hypothetical protein